jgi:hypothetical protein
MTPDGTQLVAADRLPHLATLFDVGARVEHRSVLAEHRLRNRWHHAVNFTSDPQQDGERGQQQADQEYPEFASSGHDVISTKMTDRDSAATAAP